MHSFRSFFSGETARLCYSCLARRSKDQGPGKGPRDNGKDQWQGQAADAGSGSASLAATAVASSKF